MRSRLAWTAIEMSMTKSPAPQRHTPMRTCIGTGVKKPKNEMVRLVKVQDPTDKTREIVQLDPRGKLRGRGANIDNSLEAFDAAVKKNAITRALRLERKLSTEELADLRKQMQNLLDERNFRQGQKKVILKVSHKDLQEKLQA